MDKIKKLLLENKAWSRGKLLRDPEYFKNMAKDQKPSYLWIGCSDSRVDPSELTNSRPGEMFVHRNIANLVNESDANLQSVIQYAVEALKVDHIIICGHYGCGGVKAATQPPSALTIVEKWIEPVRTTYQLRKAQIEAIPSEESRLNLLVEWSVASQLEKLSKLPIIQKSWKERDGYPMLHGWIYDLHNGSFKSTNTLTDSASLSIY